MEQHGLDLIDIIQKGAIATYPLIILSVISVAVVLERLWSLRNISSVTVRIAESLVEQREILDPQLDIEVGIVEGLHTSEGRLIDLGQFLPRRGFDLH